jgi:hypothetical protein
MKRIFSFATGNIWKWYKAKNRAVCLELIRKLDMDGVELTFAHADELLAFKLSESSRQWLRSLDYVTIHAPFRYPENHGLADYLGHIHKLYRQINAKNLIIHPYNLVSSEILGKYSMRISTENLRPHRHITPSDLEGYLQKYRGMGLCLDVAHAYFYSKEETHKLIGRFRNKITQVHVSGTYRKNDHLSLREVTRDFMYSIRDIKTLDVPIVIEEDLEKNSLRFLKDEIAYVKSLF